MAIRQRSMPLERSGNRVKAVVAYFPPTDLDTLLGDRAKGGAIAFDNSLRAANSPIHFVDAKDSPTLIISGGADKGVPISQSATMRVALDKAGVENVLKIFPDADHDFYVKGDRRRPTPMQPRPWRTMVAWFEQHLEYAGVGRSSTARPRRGQPGNASPMRRHERSWPSRAIRRAGVSWRR